MTATSQTVPAKHTYSLSELRQVPIFFVVAKSRSGTTLLQSLLSTHPYIVAPPEGKFVLHLSRFGLGRKFVPGDEKKVMDLLRYDRKMVSIWHIDPVALENNMAEIIRQGGGFSEICKLIYLAHPSRVNADDPIMISDKNPSYSIRTSLISKIFPDAKFIHLVRDYHDCVASNFVTFRKRPVGMIAWSWVHFNRSIEDHKKKHPQNCLTIQYEDLCRQPEETMQQVCNFIQIPFHAEMFGFYKGLQEWQDKIKSKTFERIHNGLLKPVNEENIGKYKKQINPKQIQITEFICSPLGSQYGYTSTTNNKPGLFTRIGIFYHFLRHKKNIAVVNLYYAFPYSIRKFLFRSVNWMYKKTGRTVRFSHTEVMIMNDK